MANRLCKIRLSVSDYATKQKGEFVYQGEVIEYDYVNKRYLYRFYQTDYGTLSVEVDFSSDIVKINELSESVNMSLLLADKSFQKCTYHLDENNTLVFDTRAFGVHISEDEVLLDYDLYDPADKERNHPMTRNVVEIICEGKIC